MKRTLQNITAFGLINLLFFSSTLLAFAQPVFEASQPFHLSLNKKNTPLTKAFLINAFAEEIEEEKVQDDFLDTDFITFHFDHSVVQSSIFKVSYLQVDFDFLKIKAQRFRHLFLLLHHLKIACS